VITASDLQPGDVVSINNGGDLTVTDVSPSDIFPGFLCVAFKGLGTVTLDGTIEVAPISMPRTTYVPCFLCKDEYQHVHEITNTPLTGICGPCNARTTAEVLRNH
jgi:hypothetical protein